MFFYLKLCRNLIIGIFSFFNHRISLVEKQTSDRSDTISIHYYTYFRKL